MAYQDLSTVQTIATGQPFLAATLQATRDALEYLIDPPSCSVFNSTAQSIPTGTATVMTANSERFDNDSMHSTSSNTSRITIQTAGRYLVFARLSFASNATGFRAGLFRTNAGSYRTNTTVSAASGAATAIVAWEALVLTAGDYVEVASQQTSGGNLDVTLAEFGAVWLTR